ncbi:MULTISPECIES: LysR family transcriptional regulator [unclassified Enterococcus]|uniref:LysR family transcriptional regulator n=1 Tax=unclassified Enterococcus TaxID=2608891 RepID=UPI00190690AD|nr:MULTISPECIES: LysR family transcriptional regulator [unclassified Enterococcus]MBK0036508.1 LysR family transcriptional regulator [Enterococcus sp. S52]MBK0069171.1 LysR family transcriptional regulator [Enterococcus sp. S53]MBK0139764.1 LysR family transcriptional regulator [Enterococcus sp. S76]MBK0143777.1 LysR family transcriptional regulator [Enterococcus sp. S77]
MELKNLTTFLAVAEKETISAAAKHLHLSQPSLSRQLMDLEKELGVTLFTRGNRKITLTEDGLLFRKRAEEIVELLEKTRSEFLSPRDTIAGNVSIGAGETYVIQLLGAIIKEIQAEYPNIKFHFYSGNADEVKERLDKGLLDFGVVISPADVKKYHSLRLPAKDTWGVLMRKDSPLAVKEVITPKDLWDVPLITSRQSLVSSELSKWLKKDLKKLTVVATYNLVYNASKLVEEGVGYGLTLDKLVNFAPDSPLCFRKLSPTLESNLDVIWKNTQVFSKASGLFLERMKEAFEEI